MPAAPRLAIHRARATAAQPPPTCHSRTLLLQLLAKLPEETTQTWAGIVEGKLTETNKINEIKPADEKRTLSSDDEDSDFTDIQFPQDTVLEKVGELGLFILKYKF